MKRYFFCAYGNMIRWSDKVESSDDAALSTFGVVDGVTYLLIGTQSPKYFTAQRKYDLHKELAKKHKNRTGNIIKGFGID